MTFVTPWFFLGIALGSFLGIFATISVIDKWGSGDVGITKEYKVFWVIRALGDGRLEVRPVKNWDEKTILIDEKDAYRRLQ